MAPAEKSLPDHDGVRRSVTSGLLSLAVASVGLLLPQSSRAAREARPENIPQPAQADREHFMRRAFELRRLAEQRGDQAYGAVIVQNGRIVGEGASAVIVNQDPTAHGEMEAIRDASRRLRTNDLGGCEIFSTARPCPMCETACYWARIARIYYGAGITDGGSPRYPSC